jgi:prophage regulatory protein
MRKNLESKKLIKIPSKGCSNPKDAKFREFMELPLVGLLRVNQVLRLVPVSLSSWWAGVKAGRYPKPLKLSERVTCWRASDIRNLVEGI